MRLEYTINPRKVSLLLGILALYLAAQSLIAEFLIENVLDNDRYRSLVLVIDLFSVNSELTIPTWYSTMLLFIASAFMAIIAAAKHTHREPYIRHWIGLAVIFLYLSMDEGAAIHEILADALQSGLTLTGYLSFGWQIVAAPLVILFALVYLRFLLHLPPHTRNLFIIAGAVYVGGALVVEGVSANQWYLDEGITFRYLAIATVEELAEMLGVVILIYALLDYAVRQKYMLAFHSQSAGQETGDPPHKLRQVLRSFSRQRPVVLVAGVIMGLNLVLVSWALMQDTPLDTAAEMSAPPSTQVLIEQLVMDGSIVTMMTGRFDAENITARRTTALLLSSFDEVVVITLPSRALSIALAGDRLPFDRDDLTEILHTNNETQFIIFDAPAVRAITGSFHTGMQDE